MRFTLKQKSIVFLFSLAAFLSPQSVTAGEPLLQLSTQSQVDETGAVTVFLTLENSGGRPLFHIHPMFHFHHTNAMMPMIAKMAPGQTLTLKNTQHPPVVRAGRYPLVAMAHYHTEPAQSIPLTALHTDSFYFQEPVDSEVSGKIESVVASTGSFLKVLLENRSAALKNVRMMLLLPPGVNAESFKGMMGFTLHGGETKYFEVPLQRSAESPDGSYPVHLMIEYGEMLKHYTGEIRGKIQFGPLLAPETLALHSLAIALMSLGLYLAYRRKGKQSIFGKR